MTVDQIGNVVKSIKGSNQTVLYDNVTLTGIRGINTLGDNQIISIGGPMYDAPTDNSVDVNYVGITSLSSNIEYASTKQGLPSKTGWLYLVSYKIGTSVKKVIYNTDGTAYYNNGGENDTWNLIQSNDIVKSINDFVGAITLTGENGNIINNNNNTITVSGTMISNTNGLVIENNTKPGIYSLSDSAFYTSNTSGLPNKAGWMYLILYKTITQSKYVIYNLDGTAYYKATNTNEWVEIQHSGSGTAGVSSINSLTGALTLNGNQGVSVTTTVNALQVSGQYYVLTQNTPVNGTLRPGVTVAGNYEFTNTPSGKTVIAIITFDYTNTDYTFTQYAICSDYSVYRRYSNADGSTATPWTLNSYSPAVDNQTITLDSLASNLGIQNLTLQLEQYRGVTFKAKFYVPFAVSNSNSPLTEIALWSLPEGWAFDEDQYIPIYIRSVSSGASSFGYIQCSNNAMQLIIGGTGQSIPAGWVVRFCNSDVYLVKSGA